jgi:hypothetical protein
MYAMIGYDAESAAGEVETEEVDKHYVSGIVGFVLHKKSFRLVNHKN